MRKKMMFLAFALAAAAAAITTPSAVAGGTHACPRCTVYADGSECCVSCICNAAGLPISCTTHFCPPADGE